MSNFTAKQQAFIDHYLITLNGTEAARLAKYKGNDVTLASVGYENLRKPHIREEIDKRLAALTMSADEALFRMTEIARGDLSKIKKPEDAGALLKKYKRTTGKDYVAEEFELYPADAAIERIMKYHGLFGAKGTEDDPIQHAITYIAENRTNDD